METNNQSQHLVLGTVQFGLNYGINNFNGQPTFEDSISMLNFAFDHGIDTFDTAFAYGQAEEILGEFISRRHLTDKIKVITKLKPNIISESAGEPYDIIAANLEESLKRMRLDSVDGYLFHTPAYIKDEKLVDALLRLKSQGLVKNIGVSIYNEDDAIYAANLAQTDYIQIPYSIFDQRLDKTDFFVIAKKNKIKVFGRSAFLQGLFFMADNKIPSHLENAKQYFKRLDEIIGRYGLTRTQAALLFSYDNKNIDAVVFGVDNLAQLKEDFQIINQKIDSEKCLAELRNNFSLIEDNIIFPSLWKK